MNLPMAHFEYQNWFRQDITRFTLFLEKSPFQLILSYFLRYSILHQNKRVFSPLKTHEKIRLTL